jgi:hypothetical protein
LEKRSPKTNLPVSQGEVCMNSGAVEFAMKETARLRQLEAECRRRALSEPQRKWYWLAQAAKFQTQAVQKIAFHLEDCTTADSPEVKLAHWPNGPDARRLMEPFVREGEQLDEFCRLDRPLRDRRRESGLMPV